MMINIVSLTLHELYLHPNFFDWLHLTLTNPFDWWYFFFFFVFFFVFFFFLFLLPLPSYRSLFAHQEGMINSSSVRR